MGCKINNILLIICFSMISHLSLGQEMGSPIITNYTADDYGSHQQVWSIVKDNRGVLYFGTTSGITEFDGANWRNISVKDNLIVRSLAIDSCGVIYVGAAGDFGYLEPDSLGNIQYHSIDEKCDSTIVKNIPDIWRVRVLGGDVFFNALDVIYKYSPYKKGANLKGKIEAIYPERRFFLSYVVNNNLYIQDSNLGLALFKNDTLTTIYGAKELLGHVVFGMISDINDKNPEEIIIALNDKLIKYNPNATGNQPKITPFKTEADDFFKMSSIYDIEKLPGKRLAIASLSKGVIVIDYDGNIVDIINSQNGLQNEIVWEIANFDNSIWLGLNNGLSQVEITSPFRFFDVENGIKGFVQAITRYKNNLFIATTDGLLYYPLPPSEQTTTLPVFEPVDKNSSETWSLLNYSDNINKDSFLLIGKSGSLSVLNNKFEMKPISEGTIFCLEQSILYPNIIYGGSSKSLKIIKRNHIKKSWDIDEIDGFGGEIRSIAESDTEIWLATFFNGVYRIEKDSSESLFKADSDKYKISHFVGENGLKQTKDIMVYSIDGEIVFATKEGFFKYEKKSNSFVVDNRFGEIFNKNKIAVYKIAESPNGDIWVDDFAILHKQKDNSYLLDTLALKTLSSGINGITYDNNTWIGGGSKGLFKYDTRQNFPENQDFHALIRGVSIKGDSLLFSGTSFVRNDSLEINIISLFQDEKLSPVIDYKHNTLVFEYSCPYFLSKESILYSYKLIGFDEEWSGWTSETRKEYTNLNEGKYDFLVKAKNVFGYESIAASYKFEILAPWYRCWWAYLFYLICLVIIVWGIVRLNTKRLKKSKVYLEGIVSDRTSEILLQKKEIEQQASFLQNLNQEITEKNSVLVQQKEAIETMVSELKIANSTKDKFYSIIAHDLRSPFNVITGFVTLLSQNYDQFSDKQRKQYINDIEKSSTSAFNLLDNLLMWALSQQDKISIEQKRINLKKLVTDAISPLVYAVEKKAIIFDNNVSEDLFVQIDIQTIKTVISNLFSNAIKFTPNSGHIVISAAISGRFVELSISDNGVGIPKEVLSSLFNINQNYTTIGTNNERGTGLGLSLCEEFVLKNGGKIWVESELNEGSKFSFTIPHSKSIVRNSFEKKSSLKKANSINKNKNLVLIVEDEEFAGIHLSILLKNIGKKVLFAKDGKSAIEICRENPEISLILMDIRMPEMSGFESTRRIREFDKDVIIVAQTAYPLIHNREKAFKAGCNEYFTKPIGKDFLLEKVIKLLDE